MKATKLEQRSRPGEAGFLQSRFAIRGLGAGISGMLFLAGCTTYVQQPPVVYEPPPRVVEVAPPPAPPVYVEPQPAPPVYIAQPPVVVVEPPPVDPGAAVEIRVVDDFYAPMSAYGHWEYIEPYGRCWVPARVDADWRPYANGYWQRTDAGWYWVSDEPWAWAAYHYGRWNFAPERGWYWVPQTEWAPAWVSWHECDGYIGWAALYPNARFGRDGLIVVDQRLISPRAYVFVEERHFLEPVRPNIVVNNTTIINKTVNITNIKVVNKTVINTGPGNQVVEHATGHPVQVVAARELRRKTEAPAVAARKITLAAPEKKVTPQPVVHNPLTTHEPKPATIAETPHPEKPVNSNVVTRVPAQPKPVPTHPVLARPVEPAPSHPVASKPADPAQVHEVAAKPAEHRNVPQPEKLPPQVARKTEPKPFPEMRPKHETIAKEQSRTNVLTHPSKKQVVVPAGSESPATRPPQAQ